MWTEKEKREGVGGSGRGREASRRETVGESGKHIGGRYFHRCFCHIIYFLMFSMFILFLGKIV